MIEILSAPEPQEAERSRKQLVEHLMMWDKIYRLDARKSIPELGDFLEYYGYAV